MRRCIRDIAPARFPAIVVLWMILALAHAVAAQAADTAPPPDLGVTLADESNKAEIVWEWDPYYTDVSANIPLTSKPIPTITSDSEAVIYRDLIEGSIIPRYMLLEASVYPMPVLGTYLKRRAPDFYKQGKINGSNINIFESLTAGFQEPWAVSAFFGNIARLVRPGETRTGTNKGYTGYLFSAGAKHIKNNVLVDDIWHELEWKIKGKRDYPDEKINWSFRLGGKFNNNPEITDVIYLGIYRSNLDHRAPILHWFKNSSFDLKAQFSQKSGKIVREDFVVGKKFPMEKQSYTPTLDVGLVWESPDEYSGALRDRSSNSLTLLFRPSIEF
ncbi:MAG: hypothetical protein HY938_01445 [Nitrosomonadales bacterium]|nr:hypothetical protein [Nitrosomonadales bacterium]